jgi:hypothetical protein
VSAAPLVVGENGGVSDQEPQGDVTGEARIRRAPRIGRFLFLGAAVGLIGTLILTSLYPADPNVGFPALFGYFALYGVPIGVALGAVLALVLDRMSVRRARTVTVERDHVERDHVERDHVERDHVEHIEPEALPPAD